MPACLPSGRSALPSLSSNASYRPGPQLARTFLTVASSTPSRSVNGLRFGASDTIAPTLRSRLAQPSRRLPMPGANESSTVEWHSAHWMPIDFTLPSASAIAVTPTTALSLSSAMVVAGSSRFDLARLELLLQRVGQRVRVDLQADGQRRLRRDARADAAVLLAGDRLVQPQRVAPERLAAEGVEAERLPPFVQHLLRVARDLGVEACLCRCGSGRFGRRGDGTRRDGEQTGADWHHCECEFVPHDDLPHVRSRGDARGLQRLTSMLARISVRATWCRRTSSRIPQPRAAQAGSRARGAGAPDR